MAEPITTTANRVKAAGYWCEDATELTQAALDKHGYTWDQEIPLTWGFENLGLANTLLALGAVRPRFKVRADTIVKKYAAYLYTMTVDMAQIVGFEIPTRVGHWLGDNHRKQAKQLHSGMWLRVKGEQVEPHKAMIAEALHVLFSEQPLHIICIHATKLLLGASKAQDNTHGWNTAEVRKNQLIKYLQRELEE